MSLTFDVHIWPWLESDARIEPPSHAANARSGGAITFTLVPAAAIAVSSLLRLFVCLFFDRGEGGERLLADASLLPAICYNDTGVLGDVLCVYDCVYSVCMRKISAHLQL